MGLAEGAIPALILSCYQVRVRRAASISTAQLDPSCGWLIRSGHLRRCVHACRVAFNN